MSGNLFARIGAIMLGGFVLLQLFVIVVMALPGRAGDRSSYGLPSPQALSQMVDAVEGAAQNSGESGANALVESYAGSLFTVTLADEAPRHFETIPDSMRELGGRYRAALSDHNIAIDGGPGLLVRMLGEAARPARFLSPLRVTIWLRDGRVLVVTGRPSDGVRAYLLQRSFLGMFAGLVLILVLLIAVRRTTQPLVRLTDQVRAVGQDIHAPDADVAGSREIRALAEAFNEMKGRIAALVQERTFILAGIAHDMRTYLTRLRLRAEFIDDDTQRDKASADMDAMAALLDDSLLFASLDRQEAAGGERIDLMGLTRQLVDRRSGAPGEVEVVAAAVPDVLGDAAALERIFNNLVDNGLRHGAYVRVSLSHEGAEAVWAFEDDGPGVPAEAMAMLGQAFARLDSSRDRRTGGAGLGLAITEGLAQSMRGRVIFGRSALGGLRVDVHIPLASD